MVVLVIGKGGVGKSTLSQALARYLVRDRRVLLIDADPDGTSALLFDAPPHGTVAALKEEMKEDRMRRVPDLAQIVVTTPSHVDLLSVGHGEAAGCYCGPNGRLKAGLAGLLTCYDMTIVDSHAGSELVSRGVVSPDVTIILADGRAGHPSQLVAQQLHRVLRELEVPGATFDVRVADSPEVPTDNACLVPRLSSPPAWLTEPQVEALAVPLVAAIHQLLPVLPVPSREVLPPNALQGP